MNSNQQPVMLPMSAQIKQELSSPFIQPSTTDQMNAGSPYSQMIQNNFSPINEMEFLQNGTQPSPNINFTSDFAVNGHHQNAVNNMQWENSRPNLSPAFFSKQQSNEHIAENGDAAEEDQAQHLYSRSINNIDTSSEVSRKTFQRINLVDRNGSRRNMVNQLYQQERQGLGQQLNLEGFNLNNWNPETMSKILYNLLQQIELVKYIIQENKTNTSVQYQHAGQRIIDTILKNIGYQETNYNGKKNNIYKARIHSIDLKSITEIFAMLNNLSLFYMKLNMNRESFVLLQCAVQICKHQKEIMENPNLMTTLYNNLGLYHARGGGKLSQRQASKYVDGAVTAQIKLRPQSEQSDQNFAQLAISYNNKAVIELKSQNLAAAQENSIKAIELIEPKVFGMINSGLVGKNVQNRDIYDHFNQVLQILLVAYYNLAAGQDGQLESRNIYLRGLQLSYKYLEGGQNSIWFRRFYLKYSRKYYQLLALSNQKKIGKCTFVDGTPRLPVPEVLPLECIQEDVKDQNESISNEKYHNFIKSFSQIYNQNTNQQNKTRVSQNEVQSFTMQDSTRTRLTHMQNQNLGSGMMLPKIQESAVSLPPDPPSQIHNNQTDIYIKAQRSEIVSSNPRTKDHSEEDVVQDNNLQETPERISIQQNNGNLQFNQRNLPNDLKLKQKDSSINRPSEQTFQLVDYGQHQTPTNQQRTENHSYNSPSMTNTAKFENKTMDSNLPSIDLEIRLQEEKLKMKQEMELHQEQLQRQFQEQQRQQMQMMQQMVMQQQNGNYSQPMKCVQNQINIGAFRIFDKLNEQQKQYINQNFRRVSYPANSNVIQEGAFGDLFFLIEDGQVEVTKKTQINPQRRVRILKSGDHFGELALIRQNETRTMGVRTLTETSFLTLDINIFKQIQSMIEQDLKQDYNQEFDKMLEHEAMQDRFNKEKEELARRQKEMDQQQEIFKQKQEELKKQQESLNTSHILSSSLKPGSRLNNQKTTSTVSIQKKESGNFETSSLLQESLNRKMSKKIEEVGLKDVWMTSNSIRFGKRNSVRDLEQMVSIQPRSSINLNKEDSQSPIETQNQDVHNALKSMSKTNISDQGANDKSPQMLVDNQTKPAQTPKNEQSKQIDQYIDFHFEKLNEQDENDLGFDDLMKQHQSLLNLPQDGVRNNTLLNFEQLVNSYDYLEDDQIRNQFYIDNLQNQQDSNFRWTPLQIKALIYLREHHRLYSAQNIWKFNYKLLQQIKEQGQIKCSQVIQQQIGQELKLYNFKVIITADYNGPKEMETLDDATDTRKYLENLASNISITLKAELDQNMIQLSKGFENVTQSVEISFLELQTILYMFSDLNSVDPNPCAQDLFSSVPYYQIDNFEHLCELLLFKYVEVFTGDDESFDQAKSQTSRVCPYSIDFKEQPSGLFVTPHKITFLQETLDAQEAQPEGTQTPIQQMSQSDNLQGQASIHSDRGLSQYNNVLNCQIDIFHIKHRNFKIVISPSFDLSLILLRRSMMNNNESDEALGVQPESLCQLQIDLQFETQAVLNEFFQAMKVDQMKFQSGSETNTTQLQKVTNSMEFYNGYLKKYIVELDKILREEYKYLLNKEPSINQDEQQGENSQGNQLNNHQKFFTLIINKRIAYVQLKIQSTIDKANKNFQSRMIVALKNIQPTEAYVKDKDRNLKFICMYCDQTTNNVVKRCTDVYETSCRALSKTFGQEIDVGFYSQVKHYTLQQLCHILIYSMKLVVEVEESSDGSGLGSDSESFGSDDDSDDDDDESGSDGKKKPLKEATGKLNVFPVVSVMFQRQVKIYNDAPVTITSEVLACNLTKKILGVKFAAYDSITSHESGVFFLIDQSQWPKLDDQKVEKDRFYTNFSVIQLLKEVGINHMLEKHLVMERHQNPLFKDKMVLKLQEPRLHAQRDMLDIVRELEQTQNMSAQQRERILAQMPPDKTSISYLERFVSKDQLVKLMKK